MTLYDFIKENVSKDDEITVWDSVWDMETYFYNCADNDWDMALLELAKKLKVVEYVTNSAGGVTVNLYEVIERSIPALEKADLFIDCSIEPIMDNMMSILSGNVSAKWLVKFADALN